MKSELTQDCISRQAALDKAYKLDLHDTGNAVVLDVIDVDVIKALPSVHPEITNKEICFSLKQLGAYFAIKIRDGKDGSVPVELLKRVREIQKYFENATSAQPDIEQAYKQGWDDCRKALEEEQWEYVRERLD